MAGHYLIFSKRFLSSDLIPRRIATCFNCRLLGNIGSKKFQIPFCLFPGDYEVVDNLTAHSSAIVVFPLIVVSIFLYKRLIGAICFICGYRSTARGRGYRKGPFILLSTGIKTLPREDGRCPLGMGIRATSYW